MSKMPGFTVFVAASICVLLRLKPSQLPKTPSAINFRLYSQPGQTKIAPVAGNIFSQHCQKIYQVF
jgi:hypothetical protein